MIDVFKICFHVYLRMLKMGCGRFCWWRSNYSTWIPENPALLILLYCLCNTWDSEFWRHIVIYHPPRYFSSFLKQIRCQLWKGESFYGHEIRGQYCAMCIVLPNWYQVLLDFFQFGLVWLRSFSLVVWFWLATAAVLKEWSVLVSAHCCCYCWRDWWSLTTLAWWVGVWEAALAWGIP